MFTRKRWGSEEILFFGPYMVKKLIIEPGHTTSMHFHNCKTETLIMYDGSVTVHFEDMRPSVTLVAGQTLTIHEGRANAHRMEAGPAGADYWEASTPHKDDNYRVAETTDCPN